MDNIVLRFLNMIKLNETNAFEDAFFSKLDSNTLQNSLTLEMSLNEPLKVKVYNELFEKICDAEIEKKLKINISFKYKKEINVRKFVDDFIDSESKFEELSDYDYLSKTKTDKAKLIFYYDNFNEDTIKNLSNEFDEFRNSVSLDCFDVCTVFKENTYDLYQDNTLDDFDIEEDLTTAFANNNEKVSSDEDDYSYNDYEEDNDVPSEEEFERLEKERKEQVLLLSRKKYMETIRSQRKTNEYFESTIKDCTQFSKVKIKGKVFFQEIISTKKQKHIYKTYITDQTSSIIVVGYTNKKYDDEFYTSLVNGTNIEVKGTIANNEFKTFSSIDIKADSIKILPPDPLKEEKEENKRVELHLHTKISAYDGVNTITEYCQLAKQYGMRGIAITDHGVVQAFPEAQKASKQYGLKMLYGCEMYMVDELENVYNPSDDVLKDATYVVFDLETTGLSSRYDRIIEFGAVKYAKGRDIETVDFFINPDMELSEKTTKITNITNSQVKSGKSIKEALSMILRFVKDSILVSHNASFDVGFLNEALKNNGMPVLTNPVIDTLAIARYMFPEQRSHNLEALCRNFGVVYDKQAAHRANYDAEVLKDSFVNLLRVLSKGNPNLKHSDLSNYKNDKIFTSAVPYHVTVYAKNQQGLKDLFELISISNLQYLKTYPRIPKKILNEKRENLIIGSSCQNGEIFQAALCSSEDIIREKMKFYDFIEVQPYTNYVNLVNEGSVQSLDQIKLVIKDLISSAKSINKPVCATGDVHYLSEDYKKFRDIYIFAKGLGNSRHPLNPYRRDSMENYENPDQMFLTTSEMKEKFDFLENKDLIEEIVVTNTNKILDMAEDVSPVKDKLYTPTIANCKELLLEMVWSNAKKMYGDPLPKEIKDRLDAELKGIDANNYYVIYYIASQLVGIANKDGYLVGSRGSVGSSLVATMSGITEVNPLPPHYICPKCHKLIWVDPVKVLSGYDLEDKMCPDCGTKMRGDGQNIPFATFLGFNAEKVPDIDLNFPSDYQAHAHELTKDLLGKDNVYKAGTIETVADKTAEGHVRGYFERFGIDSHEVPYAEIKRLAMGCTNVKRTTGQHPGGIIVIPNDMSVYDFTPIQYPADDLSSSWRTTHFDFHSIHDNVLKLDLLGHVDPFALRLMQDITNIDVKTVPFNDKNVMKLFTSVEPLHMKNNYMKETNGALGLPEFGSELGRRILRETKPKSFDDLVRISGLSHGTGVYQGNAQDFILSGKGTLHDVIGCRDDIMTVLHDKYGIDSSDSFKLMEIVRKGNYCKPAFADKRAYYEKLMKEHNVPDSYIESCEKIQYLFPKGHAVAYCMMAVRIAYFKVYYPLAYYAVYYTVRSKAYDLKTMCAGKNTILNEINRLQVVRKETKDVKNDNIYSTLVVALEMEDRGYTFESIDINKSEASLFTVDKETNKILPCLAAVDGLGENSAKQIVHERNKNGKFITVEDFVNRTGVGGSILASLRELGAFKDLPESSQISLFDAGMF